MKRIQANSQLRRMVNREDRGFGIEEDSFLDVVDSYHSTSQRREMRQALNYIRENRKTTDRLRQEDKQVDYLMTLIDSSTSARSIAGGNILTDSGRKIGYYSSKSKDKVIELNHGTLHTVSKGFGNSIGLIETRRGLMADDSKLSSGISSELKPLDILLEKTPFRLTDKFIPGHFGHVAIWVGTEEELKAAGLWDHPVILPHRDKIRQGNCVLEALRDGVQLNSLEHFLNVDDFAVVRRKGLKTRQSKETLLRSFRQIGKEYDFNFDVETLDRIVCSELVYQVFTDSTWPTEKTLGRQTISPDNVARKAVDDKSYEVTMLYLEGKKLKGDLREHCRKLIEE